jgi:uncharacterized protein YjbI with pentapeptide repeats
VSQTTHPRSRQFRDVEKLLQPNVLRASFSAIRDAHTALKEYGDQPDLPDLLSMFLKEAPQCGALISDRHTRSKAQSILDYWSLRMAAIAPDRALDAQLEEFAPSPERDREFPAAPQEAAVQAEPAVEPVTPEPAIPDTQSVADSDQIAIRFAAAARLWRDTDNLKGFLLEGDALKLGAKFRKRDPAIDDLVTESENVIRRRRRRTAALLIGSLLATVTFIFWAHSWLLPSLAKWEARQAAMNSREGLDADQIAFLERRFGRIALYQRFMPADKVADVYLTSAIFSQLNLRGIVLPAANFIQTKFNKVQFDGANLSNSSFAESPAIANVDFARANLSHANFRSSTLAGQTSFEDANLYRANFDYTNLCGVNFSGSRLKKASFRDVHLEDVAGFANSGWWLASGWNSDNYNKLLAVEDTEQDIIDSAGFQADLAETEELLFAAAAGTSDRAMALNSYALVLASWGFASPSEFLPHYSLAQASNCMTNSAIPHDALAASMESVCILESMQEPVQHLKQIAYDTLAYLQLQRNDVDGALLSFATSEASGSRSSDGGREFRHAVAWFAAGKPNEASAKLEYAMIQRQYGPSHELKTLKHLLIGEDNKPNELLARILKNIDERWPKSNRTCSPL